MISNSAKLTRFDKSSPVEGLGTELHRTVNCMKCVYDFAAQGGGVGSVNLVDDLGNPAVLPAGAIIIRALTRVETAVLSGGAATVAIRSKGAADVMAATAKASLSAAALIDGVPANTAATAVNLTADTTVQATIGTAALTAGKLSVYIEYFAR